jgi:hypothetical protein
MDEYESLSHSEVGVQVPRSFHSEMPSQGVVWEVAQAFGRGITKTGRAEGVPD